MSSPDLWQKILAALRRRWADVLASDLAAGDGFEPELPASSFVRLNGQPVETKRAVGRADYP